MTETPADVLARYNAAAAERRATVLVRAEGELENLQHFLMAETSHRSRRAYMSPLTAREYGWVMERMGRMAQRSDKLAYLAQQTMPKLNLYGDRAQLCAKLYQSFREVMGGDFYDVRGATGPEAGRPSSHMHSWTLADKISAAAWANVITDGLTDHAGGHGWTLTALAEREHITLPTV